MRVAFSGIAWDVAEDEEVARLLRRYHIDAIDIAPGKYFPRPTEATRQAMIEVKTWWRERGIELTGMQALLFGTSGLNVFGTRQSQEGMLTHLTAICRIGGELGATKLVFGSPKNRDRSGLGDAEALDIAVTFFRRLGGVAIDSGVVICLEPNPHAYGANFMTDSVQTAAVVKAVDHPAVRMQLDTGALNINSESVDAVLAAFAPLIGHVHASEPYLAPLGEGGTDHEMVYRALARHLPDALVAVEMVATVNEPHLQSMERALRVAISSYRPAVDA